MARRFHWKNLPMPARLAFGAVMLVLGVLGLFLPFLQGILFISIGLLILGHDIPAVGRIVKWVKRHPWTQRLRTWGQGLRRRIEGRGERK